MRSPVWIVRLGVPTYTVAQLILHWNDLLSVLPRLATLSLLAAMAGWIAVSREATRPVRVALSFVLTALLVLPPPGSVLVALAAAAAGKGGGVAGRFRQGAAPLAGLLASVILAEIVLAIGVGPTHPASAFALSHLLILFVLVQVVSAIVGFVMDGQRLSPRQVQVRSRPIRIGGLEAINALLAWILATLLAGSSWPPFLGLSAMVLLGGLGLRELDRALTALRESNDALAARITELATLHSIGREILSSLDPSRVFAIIESQCEKIFDVDFFLIALVDRETSDLHTTYCRRRGEEPQQETAHPPGEGLASWVVLQKRGILVSDLHQDASRSAVEARAVDEAIRSALAVPLIVEERVIGVLSVQSTRARAYDENHFSVLTTIAQQAAVAIENARHHAMATVDSLTGLCLRDYFFRRVKEECSRSRRHRASFALLMVDLDDFKKINDRRGHLVGDRYLQKLGGAIRSRLRNADLACRYGGDEFCLLLPETDLRGARVIAERIRTTISRLVVKVEGVAIRTTVSIGVAVFPDHDTGHIKGLLRKADQALYRAKRAGRDRVMPFAA